MHSSADVASPKSAAGEGRSRLRDAVANVAVLCISLGVACALGELLVRLVAPQQLILTHPEIWQPIDTLVWAHRPDVNSTINRGVSGWDPSQYLIDGAAGHRSRAVRPGSRFGFSRERRRAATHRALPAPVLAEVHALRMPRRLTYGEFIDAVLYPFNDFLAVHSQLYFFLKQRTAVLRMRAGLTTEYLPEDLLRSKAGGGAASPARPLVCHRRQHGDGVQESADRGDSLRPGVKLGGAVSEAARRALTAGQQEGQREGQSLRRSSTRE